MKNTAILSLFFAFIFFQVNAQIEIELVEFANGLSSPVDITHAGRHRHLGPRSADISIFGDTRDGCLAFDDDFAQFHRKPCRQQR